MSKDWAESEEIEEWLKLATGENDETKGVDFSTEFSGEGYRFSTNGFAIHIAKSNKPLKFFPDQKSIAVDTNRWEDQITEVIPINPKMLINALDIFKDTIQVIISISRNKNELPKMLIEGIKDNVDLSAWIMGMHLVGEDEYETD